MRTGSIAGGTGADDGDVGADPAGIVSSADGGRRPGRPVSTRLDACGRCPSPALVALPGHRSTRRHALGRRRRCARQRPQRVAIAARRERCESFKPLPSIRFIFEDKIPKECMSMRF